MQTILIIGYVWPEPTATAAGTRMLQLIKQFQLLEYQVVFASPAVQSPQSFNLNSINVTQKVIALNNDSFDEFVVDVAPDIVLYDRFMMEEQFGWRVTEKCPNAIQLLDSEDLHFLRKARQQAVKNEEELPKGIVVTDDAKREIASMYRVDATLTISEFEMSYLESVYGIPAYLLWYFPFVVDGNNVENSFGGFEERKDFVFIGNFIHAPNWDAVLQLKKQIWPLIRKQLPKAKLHIYGGYPSQKVFQLHQEKEGFYVHGRAESVSEVMQKAKVLLAPLRFGAGLKGKIIDAMLYKIPFVTSEIGAEGMFGDLEFGSSVSVNNQDFVEKSVALYNDEVLWTDMVSKGKQCLKDRFDHTTHTALFQAKLKDLKLNLHTYRAQNFTGAMLQHHTLRSTKYFSKWIEEKNKI